jgi:hypothetical protein
LLGERSRLGSSQAASRIFIDPKGEQFVKKTAPSFLIALALIVLATAGAAVAQNDMGNVATTGATFTVGVVDSFGANSVTLKKDSGDVVTILLEDATVGKDHLVNGNRVRIDYVLDDQNQAVAQEIEINGDRVAETTAIEAPAVEAPVVETETEVAVETPPRLRPRRRPRSRPSPRRCPSRPRKRCRRPPAAWARSRCSACSRWPAEWQFGSLAEARNDLSHHAPAVLLRRGFFSIGRHEGCSKSPRGRSAGRRPRDPRFRGSQSFEKGELREEDDL